MGRVLLFQLDGAIPNVAIMRIAAHHRALGDEVEFRWGMGRVLWDTPDKVYASLIFEKTRPKAEALLREFPDAVMGGTGWSIKSSLEAVGITTKRQDYSLYPKWRQSIGFTQRGCRLRCKFCVVPEKEGKVRAEQTIRELWRGDPWPRELVLLDNDFFGQPDWRDLIGEIRDGDFKVNFTQGINCRMINDESAEAIASVKFRDTDMTEKRLYVAWDNIGDESIVFKGLDTLVRHGIKPSRIMVYMLVGFVPGETHEDRDYRRRRLREFGCDPYPMPYERTQELIGFQRWVVKHYDKFVPWEDWVRARFQPQNLGRRDDTMPLLGDPE